MPKQDASPDGVKSANDNAISTIIPTDNDVLCGRGKTHFFHKGNVKFREIVGAHLGAYIQVRNRAQKSEIVRKTVREILGQDIRFLRKRKGIDKGLWYDGGFTTAKEKV